MTGFLRKTMLENVHKLINIINQKAFLCHRKLGVMPNHLHAVLAFRMPVKASIGGKRFKGL